MNQIVKFESDNGTEVQVTADEVRRVLCPGATDKEVAMFLALCQSQRLNPWIKEAYLVKYGNGPASIITGKDVFTRRANANANYEGFDAGVVVSTKQGIDRREGSAVYAEDGEKLLGGWCRVFVKGRRPFYDEVTLKEYSTGRSNWAKMPATMIRKVAIVHALREAFPDTFQGLYASEEMGGAEEPVYEVPAEATAEVSIPTDDTSATDAQCMMITDLCDDFAELRGRDTKDVMNALLDSKAAKDAGVLAGEGLSSAQAEVLIGVMRSWIAQAEAMAGETKAE